MNLNYDPWKIKFSTEFEFSLSERERERGRENLLFKTSKVYFKFVSLL